MNIKTSSRGFYFFKPLFALVILLGSLTQPALAKTFVDSFENKDMSKSTNADGFKWAANNRTSIVTQDPTDGPVAVYNNGVIYNKASATMPDNTVRDWTAKTGQYSLRFRYPAEQAWAEQRFDLGTAYRNIWLSYWLKVPANFQHSTNSPSNGKFFSLYMDGYSSQGDGPTIILGFWSDAKGGSNFNVGWSESGSTLVGGSGRTTPQVPFISYPSDQGKWMHVVFNFKASTNASSGDGVIKIWRKWNGELDYQTLVDVSDANMASPTSGPDGWKAGYLMGWMNPKYTVDTEWLLDDFTVSDQSLLNTKLPKPPVLDSLQ